MALKYVMDMHHLVFSLLLSFYLILFQWPAQPLAGGVAGHRGNGGAACKGGLLIKVVGMDSDAGVVRISLFNSEVKWDSKKDSFRHVAVPVKHGVAVARFSDLPPGSYAVMLYHDSNDNHMFDMNFMGIPEEDYGFSNNVRPLFSLPSFRSASFMVGCDLAHIEIDVQ